MTPSSDNRTSPEALQALTVNEWMRRIERLLRDAEVECGDYPNHAVSLLCSALDWDLKDRILAENTTLTAAQVTRVEDFLQRRCRKFPLQYLRGWEWFWNSKFAVGPGVLIPRPETECLVEAVLERLAPEPPRKVAELGAGSGNIGLSILGERPQWTWYAFENNPASLPFVRKNLADSGISGERYILTPFDFFERAQDFSPYDALVSNPPYVATSEIKTLSEEVNEEPVAALDGGEMGTECLARLAEWAKGHLRAGGLFLSEIGEDQGPRAAQLLIAQGFINVGVLPDRTGRDRLVFGTSES